MECPGAQVYRQGGWSPESLKVREKRGGLLTPHSSSHSPHAVHPPLFLSQVQGHRNAVKPVLLARYIARYSSSSKADGRHELRVTGCKSVLGRGNFPPKISVFQFPKDLPAVSVDRKTVPKKRRQWGSARVRCSVYPNRNFFFES